MENELIGLLKKKMNYTTAKVECRSCDHFIERTKGRGEFVCELNPAVTFEVDPEGRCDFYKNLVGIKTRL